MPTLLEMMAEQKIMSEESKKSLLPHFIIATFVVVVLLVLFWPSEPETENLPAKPQPIQQEVAPVLEPPTPMTEPEPEPKDVPQSIIELPSDTVPTPLPEPLDSSDGTVKSKLLALSDYESFARLLVNDALLERFVIMTINLADAEISANNRVLAHPDKSFRTYRQANKDWIDPASYKRYTPYVDVLDSLDTSSLMQLYDEYKPAIETIYGEIGNPSEPFEDKLKDAIDELLDTPEFPVPVEVYTESVMYKYADKRLESLSAPQKQLIRTGPENMRRIKAKLREIKGSL